MAPLDIQATIMLGVPIGGITVSGSVDALPAPAPHGPGAMAWCGADRTGGTATD